MLLHNGTNFNASSPDDMEKLSASNNESEPYLFAVESSHSLEYNTPTAELQTVCKGLDPELALSFLCHEFDGTEAFFVYCEKSEDVWIAPNNNCLNENFLYRGDLIIWPCRSEREFIACYRKLNIQELSPTKDVRKSCYVLDNPVNESYIPYYTPSYPALRYGKSTPDGMYIHKFKDRFERDAFIKLLDKSYSDSSCKEAKEYAKQSMGQDEAIIVSDGCYMNGCCAASCWYMDAETVFHLTQGLSASNELRASTIAEVVGAYNALCLCQAKGKRKITYYYDNKSIVYSLFSKRVQTSEEISKFVNLVKQLDSEDYIVNFVELHPKNSESRKNTNAALMYLHNRCDRDCRDMVGIFSGKYRANATKDTKKGRTYRQLESASKRGRGRGKNDNSGKPS